MASFIPFMKVRLDLPAAQTLFATDAQGASSGFKPQDNPAGDFGGFGIAAADLSREEILDCWRASFQPGRCVAKLDGSLGARWTTRTTLDPTTPFCRLPRFVFAKVWATMKSGRWKYLGHITAGEARAHVRCLQGLASDERCHSQRYILLEDNQPAAFAFSKGRASAPLLNYYCRRRAATNLAANLITVSPWVETGLQPADAASRGLDADSHGGLKTARSSVPGPTH